jgi:hypothetical protein
VPRAARIGVLVATLGILGALPSPANAGIGFITVEAMDENEFAPRKESYTLLASPNFVWQWGDSGDDGVALRKHNVRQDDRLFRSGDPSKSPVEECTSIGSSQGCYELSASAGTYRYYCENHGGPGGQGMSGKIKVAPALLGDITADSIGISWGTRFDGSPVHTTGDQFDVRFRVNDGSWRHWKTNTAKRKGVFGKNDNPVDVKVGRTYDFKARSEKSSNPSRRSGWSPKLSYEHVP